jgi:hypothetical protein
MNMENSFGFFVEKFYSLNVEKISCQKHQTFYSLAVLTNKFQL